MPDQKHVDGYWCSEIFHFAVNLAGRSSASDSIPRSSRVPLSTDSTTLSTSTVLPHGVSDFPTQNRIGAERVLVAVCTLNEAENIEAMVQSLRRAVPQADILVVDDDSPDGTSGIVDQLGQQDSKVRVDVRNKRGLGGAIRHGMQAAIDGNYRWLVNLDADFSHDPTRVPDLVFAAIQKPGVDVVVGSRYIAGGSIEGWPARRKWMSQLVNGFSTRALGLPVSDCSGSMRCYRVDKLVEIDISTLESEGYSILEEVLVKLHKRDAKMIEIPICFTDRTRGKSKLSISEAVRSMWKIITLALDK